MIGDVLTSSILFEALRTKYPNAQLDYLINEHTFSVVENNPFIDNFIFFTKEAEFSKWALLKLAKSIRKRKYEVVIDVYSKISSNLIALFSGASTKISKYKWYTSFIYTHTYSEEKKSKTNAGLAIENRLKLLTPLLDLKSEIIQPKIYLTKYEVEASKNFLIQHNLDLSKPIYMISVLGSSEAKTYPLNYMSVLIDSIVEETKGQILFNYIPKQEADAKLVFSSCKVETQKHIYFNIFGKNLREFIAITKHCTALIGNEGGAINMAKALNIKTFAIYSPWIDKASWNLFEDENNVSVHLKDYKSELYTKPEKTYKKEASALYDEFKPELFIDKLEDFLSN